jgi:hypothetical protein
MSTPGDVNPTESLIYSSLPCWLPRDPERMCGEVAPRPASSPQATSAEFTSQSTWIRDMGRGIWAPSIMRLCNSVVSSTTACFCSLPSVASFLLSYGDGDGDERGLGPGSAGRLRSPADWLLPPLRRRAAAAAVQSSCCCSAAAPRGCARYQPGGHRLHLVV